jgi:hypothetical protein
MNGWLMNELAFLSDECCLCVNQIALAKKLLETTPVLVALINLQYLMFVILFRCLQKGEIDAREDSFRATAEAGQKLLESKHYAVEEVKEKVCA